MTVKKRLIRVGSLSQEWDVGTKWMVNWSFLSNVSNIFVCLLYNRGCCALPFQEMIQILEEKKKCKIILLNILLTICTPYKAKEVIFNFLRWLAILREVQAQERFFCEAFPRRRGGTSGLCTSTYFHSKQAKSLPYCCIIYCMQYSMVWWYMLW